MDRFIIFESLKQLINESQPLFENFDFNPIDVLLSPIYIESINYSQDRLRIKRETGLLNHAKGFAQIHLRPLKYFFISKSNININTINQPIIFLPTEPTHIIQFDPIWNELKKKDISYLIITNKRNLFESQKKLNRPIIWITLFDKILTNRNYRTVSGIIQKSISEKIDMSPEGTIIMNTLRNILPAQLKYIDTLSNRVSRILDDFSPIAVVPGYDITPEGRLLTILAKKRNIPTYCVMHGSITGEPLDTMHIVDHFCLFGEAAKRDLIKKGVPAEQLVVTGAPYLDHFHHQQAGIHPILKNKLSLSDDKPYFLIAMSGPGHSTSYAHFQLLLETIFHTASRFPSAQWVIKMHRKDKIENYHQVIPMYPDHNIHIVANNTSGFPYSIFEWLQGATALITGNSTVAIEAMSMNIPVVTIDMMDEYKMVDFIDLGTTIHVTTEKWFSEVINQLFKSSALFTDSNEKAQRYAADFFYQSQNTASKNIVDLILPNKYSHQVV